MILRMPISVLAIVTTPAFPQANGKAKLPLTPLVTPQASEATLEEASQFILGTLETLNTKQEMASPFGKSSLEFRGAAFSDTKRLFIVRYGGINVQGQPFEFQYDISMADVAFDVCNFINPSTHVTNYQADVDVTPIAKDKPGVTFTMGAFVQKAGSAQIHVGDMDRTKMLVRAFKRIQVLLLEVDSKFK